MRFEGSFPALITPFDDQDAIDEVAYRSLISWQISSGSHGLVPCGTSGESPTLTHEEHKRVTEICIDEAADRVPVIAGCGSNATHESCDFVRHAQQAGADAALVVVPYYNRPSQEGIYRHFATIADASDLPLVIYNIPGRCAVNLSYATLKRLSTITSIIGVKDATADLALPAQIHSDFDPSFCQLSGEDATALAFLVQGGHGCISVTANVAPAACAAVHNAWQAGNLKEAMVVHQCLIPLHQAMFCESNPAPVKYAASRLGLCQNSLRLPLVPVVPSSEKIITAAMESLGLHLPA